MATKQAVAEDAPRSFREIVQKKFLDEVIGATGNNNSISILKSHCLFFIDFNIIIYSWLEGASYGRCSHTIHFICPHDV
jgi:hypothetical protein